jgi:hypothetical protein
VGSVERQLRFEFNLVNETPHPIFARLDGLHDGMFGGVEMFRGMLVFGRIAAANVTTFAAETQVNPAVAHLQAFFAALCMRMNFLNVADVRAGGAHASSFSVASELF